MRRCILLFAAAVSLSGCSRGFFAAKGAVASVGPAHIDNWSSTPQGCLRAPRNQPNSIIALLWENPSIRDAALDNVDTAPDAPLRLEFYHAEPVIATLETIRHQGIPLDATNCSVLRLHTTEHAAASAPEARPSLSGELELDCRAKGNHLTAKVTFERCQY